MESGIADAAYSFGAPGWIPVVGDWSGNGMTKIGVTNGQQWYLDENGNGVWDYVVDYAYHSQHPGDAGCWEMELKIYIPIFFNYQQG